MPAAPTTRTVTANRAARRHARIRRNLSLSAVVTVVIWEVLANTGGTYAFWSAEEQLDGEPITTGTAALDAAWETPVGDDATGLLPGDSFRRTAHVRNTGSVPLSLSVSAPDQSAGHTMRAAIAGCADVGSAPVLGKSPVPLSETGSEDDAVVVPAGDEVSFCLEVETTPELAPNTQLHYTLMIEGTQVT